MAVEQLLDELCPARSVQPRDAFAPIEIELIACDLHPDFIGAELRFGAIQRAARGILVCVKKLLRPLALGGGIGQRRFGGEQFTIEHHQRRRIEHLSVRLDFRPKSGGSSQRHDDRGPLLSFGIKGDDIVARRCSAHLGGHFNGLLAFTFAGQFFSASEIGERQPDDHAGQNHYRDEPFESFLHFHSFGSRLILRKSSASAPIAVR